MQADNGRQISLAADFADESHDLPRRLRVEESLIIRTDLYLADEVFMVGTATEVAPLRAVDDQEIGVGPVTRELQQAYLETVEGRSERYAHWLDVVETSRSAA
jgi:branched-chain amino acid aminotransferase